MNIRFWIAAMAAVISISASGQGKPPQGHQGMPPGSEMHGRGDHGPGGMRRGMNPELEKQLGLTATQSAKLKAIREKYHAKFQAAGFGGPGKPGAAPGGRADFEKMRPIFESMRKEIDAVYTPKQREIIKKWRESHRGPGFGGPGGRGPGGPPGTKPGAPGSRPGHGG